MKLSFSLLFLLHVSQSVSKKRRSVLGNRSWCRAKQQCDMAKCTIEFCSSKLGCSGWYEFERAARSIAMPRISRCEFPEMKNFYAPSVRTNCQASDFQQYFPSTASILTLGVKETMSSASSQSHHISSATNQQFSDNWSQSFHEQWSSMLDHMDDRMDSSFNQVNQGQSGQSSQSSHSQSLEVSVNEGGHTQSHEVQIEGNFNQLQTEIESLQENLKELEVKEVVILQENEKRVEQLDAQYRQQIQKIEISIEKQTSELECIVDLTAQLNAKSVQYSSKMKALQ